MRGVYQAIEWPDRLVCAEVFDDWPDTETLNTAVLTEQDGKATWTATILYPSTAARDALIQSGNGAGRGRVDGPPGRAPANAGLRPTVGVRRS